jgi:hypothetical protein
MVGVDVGRVDHPKEGVRQRSIFVGLDRHRPAEERDVFAGGNWINSGGANVLIVRDAMVDWTKTPARPVTVRSRRSSRRLKVGNEVEGDVDDRRKCLARSTTPTPAPCSRDSAHH